MASIPSLEHRVDRLRQIDGAMPRLDALPAGCRFHPRCPRVFGSCREEQPELLEAGATRAACWLHDHGLSRRHWRRSRSRITSMSPGHFCNASSPANRGDCCERWMRFHSPSCRARTFALVGESGCGKSTIARLAVGLYEPTDGDMLFENQALSSVRGQAGTAAADEHDFPGSLCVAEPALARTGHHRRTHPRLPPGDSAK